MAEHLENVERQSKTSDNLSMEMHWLIYLTIMASSHGPTTMSLLGLWLEYVMKVDGASEVEEQMSTNSSNRLVDYW